MKKDKLLFLPRHGELGERVTRRVLCAMEVDKPMCVVIDVRLSKTLADWVVGYD